MRRREFMTLLGCATVAWPLAAGAQQPEGMRRIGVLTNLAVSDPEGQARHAAFLQGLRELGWLEGRNLRVDYRGTAGDAGRARKYAAELVALAPDVILATGSAGLAPLLQVTRTIPIVFTIVPDPVGAGFADSLSRPGGNATGFSQFEYGSSGKWLELLKEIAPGVARVAVLREPGLTAAIAQFAALQAVAPSMRVELVPLNLREAGDIERSLAEFARSPADGLIVTSGPLASVHRDLIIAAAARHKLPAVYNSRFMAAAGGLISYGPDFVDQYRLAARYVDRILRAEKPGDLPVQAPTKYELLINLRTAKALGLEVPPTLLARADEVIE
jgi:putative ABC transport system substrate-binding protein